MMPISDFWVAGVSYKKTDAATRGLYSVSSEQYASILQRAGECGIREIFILSTCNRTEIYALTGEVDKLLDIFCAEINGCRADFDAQCYIKRNRSAVEHLFHVSAGLDSQVLGDYEIVGQIKQAVAFSKDAGFMGPILQRLINIALQASKAIKNTTALSGGTVSVSFTAIQYIREHVPEYRDKKILLLGIGKIGRNTCKNLVDYLDNKNIVLTNRTPDKAEALANAMGLQHAALEDIGKSIQEADIIITCTNSLQPIVTKELVGNGSRKVIIDLAIPYNVDPTVRKMENITLLNVDELSRLKDETLQKREAEVPKAKAIIDKHIGDFMLWLEARTYAPALKTLRKKLWEIADCLLVNNGPQPTVRCSEARIQRTIGVTASRLQVEIMRGCIFLEAINEFIAN
jgi:glutamyl-tRNA reductase